MQQLNRTIAIILCLCGCFFVGNGQNLEPNTQVTIAKKIGVTPPLRDLAPINTTPEESRKLVKQSKKVVADFRSRGQRPAAVAGALPQGVDPVLQPTIFNFSEGELIAPLLNKDGMTSDISGANVPDPVGDIGRHHYVQVINTTFIQVFDKQGNSVTSPIAANTIWSTLGYASGGDPIILYDHQADRWILTEFPNTQGGNQILVAVSDTTDPLETWTAYHFATPDFPDYPKYSIWPNALVLTTNEGGSNDLPAYFLDRQALLSGAEEVTIQRLNLPGVLAGPGFLTATPVDWNGQLAPVASQQPLLLKLNDDAWGDTPTDQIELITATIDFENPANSMITVQAIPTAPFDTYPCSVDGPGFTCIPQLGGTGLDGLPEIIMNQSHYRNFGTHESIVLNFITDASGNNRAGIRWMELQRTTGQEWSVYQEGTYAPDDNLHRFMGAIAMDGGGNIALAYSISGTTIYPGLRFTGRRKNDPLGEMTVEEYTLVNGTSQTNNDRYGDYAHMGIDPVDNRSFWFTGQYMGENGWATRIAKIQVEKDTLDIGPLLLASPQNSPALGAAETVRVRVKNFGLEPLTGFNISYEFEGQPVVTESVNTTITPGATYLHTFNTTVNLETIGDYEFKIFTTNTIDQSPFNDTIRAVVTKLPQFDVGVTRINGVQLYVCNDSITANFDLYNYGTATLTSALIDVVLNDEVVQTINWQGSLLTGNSINFDLLIVDISTGNNELVLTAYQPNGVEDQRPVNNSRTQFLSVSGEELDITMRLILDQFANETSWQVTDLDGNVQFTGGPYSTSHDTIIDVWCLDPAQCYRFFIYDSFGDGFCCTNGEGSYRLTDPDGNLIRQGDGVIGMGTTIDFCVSFVCAMTAEITTADPVQGSQNGAIFIQGNNGLTPYKYSIDGGETFKASGVFASLEVGMYEIMVRDENGCEYTELVTLGMPTSVVDMEGEAQVSIYPNPSDGVFQLSVSDLAHDHHVLELTIFNAQGQEIQQQVLPAYNDIFTGKISLFVQPAGVYFIRLETPQITELVKVIKR